MQRTKNPRPPIKHDLKSKIFMKGGMPMKLEFIADRRELIILMVIVIAILIDKKDLATLLSLSLNK